MGWDFSYDGDTADWQMPSNNTYPRLAWEHGSLQFKSSTYSVAENAGSIRIYVSRINGSYGAASVNYTTANGTAMAGSDYTAKSGTLNWSDGNASDKYFDVSITDDNTTENNETFMVTLSGAGRVRISSPIQTTVTIVDNDPLTGNLQITLGPAEAAGAQWNIDGGA